MNEEMNNEGSNNLTNNVNNDFTPNMPVSNETPAVENIPNPVNNVEVPVEPQSVNLGENNIQPTIENVQPPVMETPNMMETPNAEISSPVENPSVAVTPTPVESNTAVINEVVSDISANEGSTSSAPAPTADLTPQQGMVPPQEPQSTIVPKKKSKLPLILLIVLLVAACCAGALYFLQTQKSTQNIYQKTITDLSSNLIKIIDSVDNGTKDMFASNFNVSLNANSLGAGNSELAETLNKLKLNGEVQADIKNGKAYINLDALYDSGSMLKAELLLKDKSLYLLVPELYGRAIKLSDVETTDESTTNVNLSDYKTIIQEFSNILKLSLKNEWFSKTKETISVLGSNVSTYKHTLTLNAERIKELSTSIIDRISNNDKMLTALSNISGLSKDEIKANLSSTKENMQVSEGSLEISVYLNKNDELQQLTMKSTSDGNEQTIELSMSDVDTFDLLIDKEKLGSLVLKENDYELTLNADGASVSFIFKGSDKNFDLSLKIEDTGTNMEINFVINDTKGNLKLLLSDTETGIDLSLNVQIDEKEISTVKEFDVSTFINAEEMPDGDMQGIMEKIQSNSNLLKLLEDISNSGLADMFGSEM